MTEGAIHNIKAQSRANQKRRRADVLAKYEASGCRSVAAHHRLLYTAAGGDFMSCQAYTNLINRARDDKYQEQITEKGKK
jgi:hypothetical protein